MRRVKILVYALVGAVAVIYGLAALILPSGLSSEAATDGHLAHIMREQGAAILFVGLMAFWCMFNYGQSKTIHYFLIVFTFALALIHWYEFLNDNRSLASPLLNSVPFLILLATAFLDTKRSEAIT